MSCSPYPMRLVSVYALPEIVRDRIIQGRGETLLSGSYCTGNAPDGYTVEIVRAPDEFGD
jgi:hypothetical protein